MAKIHGPYFSIFASRQNFTLDSIFYEKTSKIKLKDQNL